MATLQTMLEKVQAVYGAGRGGSHRRKTRILREGVGSMRFQVEQEQRKVLTDDQARQRKEEQEAP